MSEFKVSGSPEDDSLDMATSALSLRDYFAAHARGTDIYYFTKYDANGRERGVYLTSRQAARYAYADAMLSERAKGRT